MTSTFDTLTLDNDTSNSGHAIADVGYPAPSHIETLYGTGTIQVTSINEIPNFISGRTKVLVSILFHSSTSSAYGIMLCQS